jgi:hypothetical protein
MSRAGATRLTRPTCPTRPMDAYRPGGVTKAGAPSGMAAPS